MNNITKKLVVLSLFTCISSQAAAMEGKQNTTYRGRVIFDLVYIQAYNSNRDTTTVLSHKISTNEFKAYSTLGKSVNLQNAAHKAILPSTFISSLQKLAMMEKKQEKELACKSPDARPIKKALQELKNTAIIKGKIDNEKIKKAESTLIQLDSERAVKEMHFTLY